MRSRSLLLAMVLVVTACGGSGDDAGGTAITEAPATTSAPATTEASATAEAAGESVAVTLSEFEIETQDTFTAGQVTFDVINDGTSEFNHEFAIIAAGTYEELPKLDNGAVDEDALADGMLLGRTERLEPGQAETIAFDLEPGTYLFICNVNFGPNSHAANGQTLTVTVNS